MSWPASPYPAVAQLLASPSLGVSVQGLSLAGSSPPLARRVFSQASLSSSERVWCGAGGPGSAGPPLARDAGVPRGLLTCSRASSRPRWAMRMRRCWGEPAAAPGWTWQPSRRRAQTGRWAAPGSGNMRRAPCRTAHHSRCQRPRSRTARNPAGTPPSGTPRQGHGVHGHPLARSPTHRTSFSIFAGPGAAGSALLRAILLLLLAKLGPGSLRMEIQRDPSSPGFKHADHHPKAIIKSCRLEETLTVIEPNC